MSPITKQLGLLTLAASAAIAAPQHGLRHAHHHHSGRPVYASGSGAPYGFANGTGPYATGSGLATGTSGPTSVSDVTQTQTVTSYSYVTATDAAAAANADVANAKVAAADDTCSSVATVTMTNTVTVTASSSAGGFTYSAVEHWHQHSFGPPPPPSSSSTSTSVSVTPSTSSSTTVAAVTSVAAVETSATSATSTVAASSSTTASSSASAAASTSAVGTSGKRGCAFNNPTYCDAISSSEQTWAYSWNSSTVWWIDGDELYLNSSLNYVPMLYSNSIYDTSIWPTEASGMPTGTTHIMGFNEPDNDGDANMSPSEAVSTWQTYMNKFSGTGLNIGAPAVSNSGDSGAGFSWLASFLSECGSNCGTIDFIPIHWYNTAGSEDDFKTHVAAAYSEFVTSGTYSDVVSSDATIWVTEFGLISDSGSYDCTAQSQSDTADFLTTILPWLDEQDYVERYSYFMAAEGCLVASSGSGATTAGAVYTASSS